MSLDGERPVEELLARPLSPSARPVYVHGLSYYLHGDETSEERVALHEYAIREHAAEQARLEAEREASGTPGRGYFDAAFLRLDERLDAIEHALAARER